MKFLSYPELTALSNCLSSRIVGDVILDGRVEAYSMKQVRADRKLEQAVRHRLGLATSHTHLPPSSAGPPPGNPVHLAAAASVTNPPAPAGPDATVLQWSAHVVGKRGRSLSHASDGSGRREEMEVAGDVAGAAADHTYPAVNPMALVGLSKRMALESETRILPADAHANAVPLPGLGASDSIAAKHPTGTGFAAGGGHISSGGGSGASSGGGGSLDDGASMGRPRSGSLALSTSGGSVWGEEDGGRCGPSLFTSGASVFGGHTDRDATARQQLPYLIGCLNSAFPDYDFASLPASCFHMHPELRSVITTINTQLLDLAQAEARDGKLGQELDAALASVLRNPTSIEVPTAHAMTHAYGSKEAISVMLPTPSTTGTAPPGVAVAHPSTDRPAHAADGATRRDGLAPKPPSKRMRSDSVASSHAGGRAVVGGGAGGAPLALHGTHPATADQGGQGKVGSRARVASLGGEGDTSSMVWGAASHGEGARGRGAASVAHTATKHTITGGVLPSTNVRDSSAGWVLHRHTSVPGAYGFTFTDALWAILDDIIDLKGCDIWSYQPTSDDDPLLMGALWAFNFFFVNLSRKKLVFFAVVARSKMSSRAAILAQPFSPSPQRTTSPRSVTSTMDSTSRSASAADDGVADARASPTPVLVAGGRPGGLPAGVATRLVPPTHAAGSGGSGPGRTGGAPAAAPPGVGVKRRRSNSGGGGGVSGGGGGAALHVSAWDEEGTMLNYAGAAGDAITTAHVPTVWSFVVEGAASPPPTQSDDVVAPAGDRMPSSSGGAGGMRRDRIPIVLVTQGGAAGNHGDRVVAGPITTAGKPVSAAIAPAAARAPSRPGGGSGGDGGVAAPASTDPSMPMGTDDGGVYGSGTTVIRSEVGELRYVNPSGALVHTARPTDRRKRSSRKRPEWDAFA